jgi:DNA-binding XRE family transcriptional regulator
MDNLDFKSFKSEALQNAEVKKEYESLEVEYAIKKELIEARKKAGLTQEDVAQVLHTQKSNISRLESFNYKSSPKLSTLLEYAKALGYELELHLKPSKIVAS